MPSRRHRVLLLVALLAAPLARDVISFQSTIPTIPSIPTIPTNLFSRQGFTDEVELFFGDPEEAAEVAARVARVARVARLNPPTPTPPPKKNGKLDTSPPPLPCFPSCPPNRCERCRDIDTRADVKAYAKARQKERDNLRAARQSSDDN